MKTSYGLLLIALLVSIVLPVSAEEPVGGDQGWYVIHCNVYDAKVYLDDKYVGSTGMGTLTVPVSTTGTPYTVLRVQKYGYVTYTESLATKIPAKSQSIDLYATLNPVPETTTTLIGGDMGWYVVHCNVEGATVLFDNSNKGEISQGAVYVPVYSTGTPYRTVTVKKDGYSTYTANLEEVPAKGQTIDITVSLNPVATTVQTTPVAIGGDIGWYKIHSNVNGATVSLNNEEKGKITDGSLTVQVYVTGTPYRTFTVYKAGFVPYSGSIDKFPKKGETIDLYATLNPAEETTVIPATTKSPLPPVIPVLALFLAFIALAVSGRR